MPRHTVRANTAQTRTAVSEAATSLPQPVRPAPWPTHGAVCPVMPCRWLLHSLEVKAHRCGLPQMLIWMRIFFGETRRAVGSEGAPWDIGRQERAVLGELTGRTQLA